MKTKIIIAISAIGLAFSCVLIAIPVSFANPGHMARVTKPQTITAVQTSDEASELPVGTKLTITCQRCGGVQTMTVDAAKSHLTWFNPLKAHRCPGPCGGFVRYTSYRAGTALAGTQTLNTCSRCRQTTISWLAKQPS